MIIHTVRRGQSVAALRPPGATLPGPVSHLALGSEGQIVVQSSSCERPGAQVRDGVPDKDTGAAGMVRRLLMSPVLPGHLLLAPVFSEWEVAGFSDPDGAAHGLDRGRRLCSAGHRSVFSTYPPLEQVSPALSSWPL